MSWPKHLFKTYHETNIGNLGFPMVFGTQGCPPNDYVTTTQPLIHSFINRFILSHQDKTDFNSKFRSLLNSLNSFDKLTLKSLLTPALYEETTMRLLKMKQEGYRLKLKNKWEYIQESKLYGYLQLNGISPIPYQNYDAEAYDITQLNFLHFPFKIDLKLKENYVPKEQVLADLTFNVNPFEIRNFERNSRELYSLMQKYPISLLLVDCGMLSQMKLHIVDLYSRKKTVEGDDVDEYEFHLLRFQKLIPTFPERFARDPDYKRFIDTNFSEEYFNWMITDIDRQFNYFPVSSSLSIT